MDTLFHSPLLAFSGVDWTSIGAMLVYKYAAISVLSTVLIYWALSKAFAGPDGGLGSGLKALLAVIFSGALVGGLYGYAHHLGWAPVHLNAFFWVPFFGLAGMFVAAIHNLGYFVGVGFVVAARVLVGVMTYGGWHYIIPVEDRHTMDRFMAEVSEKDPSKRFVWKSNAPLYANELEAQQAAVAKYPQLGKRGTFMNNIYVERVKQRRQDNPAFFTNVAWPVLLADDVAREMGVTPPAPQS